MAPTFAIILPPPIAASTPRLAPPVGIANIAAVPTPNPIAELRNPLLTPSSNPLSRISSGNKPNLIKSLILLSYEPPLLTLGSCTP